MANRPIKLNRARRIGERSSIPEPDSVLQRRAAHPENHDSRPAPPGAGESSNTVISFDEPSRIVGPQVPVPGET